MTDTPTREQVEALRKRLDTLRICAGYSQIVDEAAATLAALQARVEELEERLQVASSGQPLGPIIGAQQIVEDQQRIAALESELHRVRTHETAAAHELDKSHDDESRKRFKATCDRLAALESDLATARAALDLRERLEAAGIVVWFENSHWRVIGPGYYSAYATRPEAFTAAVRLLERDGEKEIDHAE